MNGRALYNEIIPFSATRIRARIAAGLVCPGDVDERDVRDILPAELDGYSQVHLFAGGGAWSYALRLAGWPDRRNVWTLSCPCQPFSSAGRRGGTSDKRHLWPSAFHLVDVHRPDALFGEQVASKDGLAWLDLVLADLEGAGYAVRAQDTCSAGVGAPNIRQRLYFVAQRLAGAHCDRQPARRLSVRPGRQVPPEAIEQRHGEIGRMAGPDSRQRDGRTDPASGHDGRGQDAGWPEGDGRAAACGDVGGVADASRQRHKPLSGGMGAANEGQGAGRDRQLAGCCADLRPGPVNGFWRDADWLWCRDERWRPALAMHVKLAAGISADLGRGRLDAAEDQTCRPSALPVLRRSDGAEALERWRTGGDASFQAPQVLRPNLHGAGHGEGEVQQPQSQPLEGNAHDETALRKVRRSRTSSRSSQGRRSEAQRPAQFDDVVRLLPPSLSLAALHGDGATANALRVLCGAICAAGSVQYAPDQISAVWASLSQEAQGRIRLDFDAARWVVVEPLPLGLDEADRAARLREHGNAINVRVAAGFIADFLADEG